MSCPPPWLRRQKTSSSFTFPSATPAWHIRGGTQRAEGAAWWACWGPPSHTPQGRCVARWAPRSPSPDRVRPPPSSHPGTAAAAGSGLAHTRVPVQRRGGQGDLSQQAPDLPSQGTPAFTLGRGYGWHVMQLLTTEKFPQQARSALSPQRQRLHPCTQAWDDGMCCGSGSPSPRPPRPPAAMSSTRYGRQMIVWHRLTSSEGSGMSGAPCPPAWPSKAEEGLKVRSLCGWLPEAAGGGCRDCWLGGPLWCNGCPDWLLGWGTCKPCCMEVWDWSVLPGWGICGGGKKQEKKVRPQGTVLAVPDSVTAC